MSYIDIFVLVIIGLGLFFGLFGRWQNKLVALCSVAASAVTSYFICTPITNAVLKMDSGILSFIGGESGLTILDFLKSKLNFEGMDLSAMADMVPGLVKVVVFWLCAIALMLVLGLLTKIIFGIIFRHTKKGTAIRTLGLIGAVKGALVAIILVFPVFAFAPALKNLTAVPMIADNQIVQMVEDHTNKSKAVTVTDWVFKNTKMQMMTYEHDGQTMYLYDDLEKLPGLIKSVLEVKDMLSGGNPIEALAQMEPEQLQEVFDNIANAPQVIKDTVTNVVSGIVRDMTEGAIQIENIDFEKEGKMFATVASVLTVNTDDPDNIKVEIDEESVATLLENPENLADALADSELVTLFAGNMQGMFSEIDPDSKSAIEAELETKLAGNEDKLNLLKGLFKAE